jgi:hypothetical protein
MRISNIVILPGPGADQLMRKAYVAGYDRRLRHPTWVVFVLLLIPSIAIMNASQDSGTLDFGYTW